MTTTYVAVQCMHCLKMVSLERALVDHKGPAFKAYYCADKTECRECLERLDCERRYFPEHKRED